MMFSQPAHVTRSRDGRQTDGGESGGDEVDGMREIPVGQPA